MRTNLRSMLAGALIAVCAAVLGGAAINGGQPTSINGSAGFSRVVFQSFLAGSSTYTPTPGMVYAIIECQGPGGGGGGAASTTAGTINGGGGGGAGDYSRVTVSAATVGASQAVTVGFGGSGGAAGNNAGNPGNTDTSVGSLCVGKLGSGGGGAAAGAGGTAGTAGAAGTGDVSFPGQPGQAGGFASITTVSVSAYGGMGGSAFLGRGSAPTIPNSAGVNAPLYGGGGSGGSDFNAGGTKSGGNGANGLVMITEYVR